MSRAWPSAPTARPSRPDTTRRRPRRRRGGDLGRRSQILAAHAGQIANRNFTRDEWRQYFPEEPYRATFPDLPVPPETPSQRGEGLR